MSADLSASAYLVDGADLATADAELTHDGAGLWSGLFEDIGVATAAGANGGMIAGGVFRPFTHSMMYKVRGASAQAVWAEIVDLRRRCKPGRTVTLTRRMPDPDGTDANIDLTTTGRRITDRPDWLEGSRRAVVDIDWLITGGPWLGASVAIAAVGTVTVKGDLPTRLITVTLAAGAVNPTVANSTNGYSFTYGGTVPTGGVTVDVINRRATKVSDSTDVSSLLTWAKSDPLQLDPGANTLTISSGTASFAYYPAYQ